MCGGPSLLNEVRNERLCTSIHSKKTTKCQPGRRCEWKEREDLPVNRSSVVLEALHLISSSSHNNPKVEGVCTTLGCRSRFGGENLLRSYPQDERKTAGSQYVYVQQGREGSQGVSKVKEAVLACPTEEF